MNIDSLLRPETFPLWVAAFLLMRLDWRFDQLSKNIGNQTKAILVLITLVDESNKTGIRDKLIKNGGCHGGDESK